MTRILIVDDEPQIARALALNLKARQFEVAVARDGTEALRRSVDWHPDVIVLDLGLPDLDGIEVINGLRGWSQVPIVVLSGRVGPDDKITALDAGADDYVTKPFGVEELLARVRAVTRRVGSADLAPTVQIGEHVIDLAAHTITPDLHLTPIQWRLVEVLLRNPGKLISQRWLITQIWGPAHIRKTHYLRQYMGQLRRKLEADPSHPRHLLTEPGMGYRFQP